jgi:protein TonB
MALKNKPYEQFGSYVLFKKLESDSVSELWRASGIEETQLGPLVALRKLTGGNRAALVSAAAVAGEVAPLLTGTSFAKHQEIGVFNGIPYVAHEYGGGRSLRHIIDRARGSQGVAASPLPLDLAVTIAERVALSLDTLSSVRFGGNRLDHGALIPQFIWITDDGEIRVAGQMLGPGFVASLKDSKVAAEIGRYFAPEYQATGEPQKTSAVYGLGAILYLVVTGLEPPDPMTSSAWTQSVRASKTMAGGTIPEDLRAVLGRSFVLDPAARYASISEMKQALSSLAHGGVYSGNSFNLAFYLSTLLKKEMEGEAVEHEKESKVSVAPYLEAEPEPVVVPAVVAPPSVAAPDFGVSSEPQRSKAPLAIAALVVLAALGGVAWYMTAGKTKPNPAAAAAPVAAPPPSAPKPLIVSEPIVASSSTSSTSSTATTPATSTSTTAGGAAVDAAAQKKAFEDAVNRKLQAEMMKLQDDYTSKLQQQQAHNAPAPASPAPQPQPAVASATVRQTPPPRPQPAEDHSPSAAQLDQSRRETARAESTPPAQAPPVIATQAPVPQPAAPTVREGDVVLLSDLDTVPHVIRPSRPVYPPMAARQRAEANVLITVLVSESGDVMDARVLRGDARYGFEDAAVRAAKTTKFSPGIKDGKRVRTWFPLPFIFKQ